MVMVAQEREPLVDRAVSYGSPLDLDSAATRPRPARHRRPLALALVGVASVALCGVALLRRDGAPAGSLRAALVVDGVAASDDTACASMRKAVCQKRAECQWHASESVCFNQTSGVDDDDLSDDDTACATLVKPDCQLRAECQWYAASSVCFNTTLAASTANHTPQVNHTVNASKHAALYTVGPNTTLDDDVAAEARCANITTEAGCKSTAQCEWSLCRFTCLDPTAWNVTTDDDDGIVVDDVATAPAAPPGDDGLVADDAGDDDATAAAACAELTGDMGACQTALACRWRASDASCFSPGSAKSTTIGRSLRRRRLW